MRLISKIEKELIQLNYCFCTNSSLFSNSILGIYRPGEFIFQCYIFVPYLTVDGVLKARMLNCFPSPSQVDKVFSELSTITCLSWVALQDMAHSFIELDKAVIYVISFISFL